jgi:hypothetical protein
MNGTLPEPSDRQPIVCGKGAPQQRFVIQHLPVLPCARVNAIVIVNVPPCGVKRSSMQALEAAASRNTIRHGSRNTPMAPHGRETGGRSGAGCGGHLRHRSPFGLGPARPARFDLIRGVGQQDVSRAEDLVGRGWGLFAVGSTARLDYIRD